jgi:hypothetical protein
MLRARRCGGVAVAGVESRRPTELRELDLELETRSTVVTSDAAIFERQYAAA